MNLKKILWMMGLATAMACSPSSPLRHDGGAAGSAGSTGSAGHAPMDGGAGTAGAGGAAGSSGTTGSAGTTGAAGAVIGPDGKLTLTFGPPVTKNVDILFMIDNSSSMTPLQKKLIDSFPSFITALQDGTGGLPNLHIGIVSSTMGAGRNENLVNCQPGGDQGMFQSKPVGTTCAEGSLNPGQNFIIAGPGSNNFSGNLSAVFSCIAALGTGGCGFEHQFASVLRALGADGAPSPATNANFLRPNALLQVVLLTNEDDCSAPPNSDLFDSTTGDLSDPLGPLQSYRCNEFGHLCGGQPPPRTPAMPVDLSGTCVSAEDGRLLRVKDVIAALKGLKPDPSKVLVSAIGGPPSPYIVDSAKGPVPDQLWPEVRHSCMAADGNYADPGVRLHQLTDAFGDNGSFQNICDDGLGAETIAAKLAAAAAGWPCLDAIYAPSQCTFVDHLQGGGTATLQSCTATGGAPPCWTLGPDGSCTNGHVVEFKRNSAPVVTSTTATCTK